MAEQWMRVALVAGFVGTAVYTFFYAFRPWFTTSQGRALMVMAAGKVLWLGPLVAAMLWPEHVLRPEIFAALFTVWVVGILYLTISLLFSPGSRKYPPWSWACALCRRGRAS